MSYETSLLQTASRQHSEEGRSATSPFNDTASQSTTTSAARRKKHVTTACISCRKSKAKCDGKHPCGRCSEKLYTCLYAMEEDNRNRSVMKRRIAELEDDVSILYALMSVIRTSDDQTIAKVIECIRKGTTPREIKEFLTLLQDEARQSSTNTLQNIRNTMMSRAASESQLETHSELRSSAALSPQERASSFVMPRKVFGVDRLTDLPTQRVPAAPWTSVIDDNDLVSHLVSLYATWEHMFFDGVVLDLFIRDMKSQNPASNFCSPFLVNCILATACPYSDFSEVKTNMGRTSTLMDLFIGQAESLREECSATSILTAVQGLSLLSIATKKQNDDVRSRHYTERALLMCSALLFARQDLIDAVTSPTLKEELTYTIESALWGALNISGASLDGWRPPLTVQPLFDAIGTPPISWQRVSEVWQPYPISNEAESSLYSQSRQYYPSLSLLSYEISQEMARILTEPSSSSDDLSQKLEILSTQLFSWIRGLPTQFRSATSALPISAILLRWWAAYFAMAIFKAQADLETSSRNLGQQGPLVHTGYDSEFYQLNPKETLIASALDTVSLCGHFREIASDYSRIHPLISITFREALLTLVDAGTNPQTLVQEQQRSYDAEITELCVVFRDMSRRNPYTAALVHATVLEIREKNLRLPSEAARQLQHIDRV